MFRKGIKCLHLHIVGNSCIAELSIKYLRR
nr:MAG TPA: Protein of unknown function (DUF501) [Caudoviricetes sp.]